MAKKRTAGKVKAKRPVRDLAVRSRRTVKGGSRNDGTTTVIKNLRG